MHYISHLSKDRKLKKIAAIAAPIRLQKRKKIYLYLCRSIMSQQLSTKVADVIHKRFIQLYGGRDPLPQEILDTPFDTLRAIGLSNAKTNYVRHVAEFELLHGMDAKKLAKMTDEEVINYLTQIKGVGRWTVEMLLMFALGREDVLALDDLGIQQAMAKLYRLDASDRKKLKEEMQRIGTKWSPYRTYACRILWDWKDQKAM
ncbi:MAG: DNA-3-methyladenine glycosylase 2 family protein [Chitinophagaceae bacterium]|nr:DNA-3-methyladenine glycosylase 2 family protein [Chitinophagaceae bacterium]